MGEQLCVGSYHGLVLDRKDIHLLGKLVEEVLASISTLLGRSSVRRDASHFLLQFGFLLDGRDVLVLNCASRKHCARRNVQPKVAGYCCIVRCCT